MRYPSLSASRGSLSSTSSPLRSWHLQLYFTISPPRTNSLWPCILLKSTGEGFWLVQLGCQVYACSKGCGAVFGQHLPAQLEQDSVPEGKKWAVRSQTPVSKFLSLCLGLPSKLLQIHNCEVHKRIPDSWCQFNWEWMGTTVGNL